MYYLPWEIFIFIGLFLAANFYSKYETNYARLTLYFCMWLTLHHVSIYLFQVFFTIITCLRNNWFQRISNSISKNSSKYRVSNFKRLLRSQIYCIIATTIGLYLLFTEYYSWPTSLLKHWSPLCEPAFELALSHWIFSLYEDYLSNDEVSSHMTPMPGETKLKLFKNYYVGLVGHHVFTILAYIWSLWTHNLAGLCVFGLLFEVPVIIINIREFVVAFDKEVQFPFQRCSKWMFQFYGHILFGLFHLSRTLFCALYPLSLCIWRRQLYAMPWGSHVMYHILGLLFCSVNFILYGTFFTRYLLEDGVRAGLISEKSVWTYFHVKEKYIDALVSQTVGKDDIEQQISSVDSKENSTSEVAPIQSIGHIDRSDEMYLKATTSSKASDSSVLKTTKSIKIAIDNSNSSATITAVDISSDHTSYDRAISAHELSSHTVPSSLWIAINGFVYDVTTFQNKHPGGANMLLQAAGKDSSAQFIAVGHSQTARRTMDTYKIGRFVPAISTTDTNGLSKDFEITGEHVDINSTTSNINLGDEKRHAVLDTSYKAPWYTEEGPYDTFKTYSFGRDLYFPATTTLLACIILFAGGNRFIYDLINTTSKSVTPMLPLADTINMDAIRVTVKTTKLIDVADLTKSAATIGQVASAHAMMICLSISIFYMIQYISQIFSRSHTTNVLLSSNGATSSITEYFKLGKIISVLITTKVLSTCILLEMLLLSLPSYILTLNSMRISLLLSYSIETLLRKRSLNRVLVAVLFASNAVDIWGLSTELFKSHPSIAVFVITIIILSSISRLICMRTVTDTSTLVPVGMIALLLLWHLREWFIDLNDGTDVLQPLYMTTLTSSANSSSSVLDIQSLVSIIPGYPLLYLPTFLLSYLLWPSIYKHFISLTEFSTIQFSSQFLLVVSGIFLWSLSGSVGPARWWAFVLSFYGLARVSYECGMTLQSGGASAPRHLFRPKQIEDAIRTLLAAWLSQIFVSPVLNLLNLLLPLQYKYYFYPTPVFDFGDAVDYGVAFQVNGDPQQQPTVFQHNVGHLGHSEYDHVRTGTATRDMMWELINDPEAGKKGFVADTVAIFPLYTGGARSVMPGAEALDYLRDYVNPSDEQIGRENIYKFREINLSAWSSEKAAYNWYKNSAAHKKIVKEYHNGDLQEFSAMLATLAPPPNKPIRWDTRCRNCHKMTGNDPGHNTCPHCNYTEKFPLPYL